MNNRILRHFLLASCVAALVLAGGLLVSGTEFTYNIQMVSGNGPDSFSGINWFCLPSLTTPAIINARELFHDIEQFGPVQFLNRHRSDDFFEVYTYGGGTLPPNGWNLEPGDAQMAKVADDFVYTVTGSDIQGQQIFLNGGPPGSGTNFICLPSYSTAVTAKDLFQQIGGSIQFVFKHRPVDDLFEVYTFGGGTIPPNGWYRLPPGGPQDSGGERGAGRALRPGHVPHCSHADPDRRRRRVGHGGSVSSVGASGIL